jgi:hypothetical protein
VLVSDQTKGLAGVNSLVDLWIPQSHAMNHPYIPHTKCGRMFIHAEALRYVIRIRITGAANRTCTVTVISPSEVADHLPSLTNQ